MSWNASDYQSHCGYVWQHGESLVDQLAPQPGECMIDLGCGTGQLTQQIAKRGAMVTGLDSDRTMIDQATANYPNSTFPNLTFQVADAARFNPPQPVDAIFSNAALHWVTAAESAAQCISAALKPGGRFVAEFGGAGNVSTILTALQQVSGRDDLNPWYFPRLGAYSMLLEAAGLSVVFAHLFDRPTPLGESGLAGWLAMFGQRFFPEITAADWTQIVNAVERKVPELYQNGEWIADYKRLRIVAFKP